MVPELALRDALLAHLRAAPEIAALVGAKVYDAVPSDDDPAELPWLCLGAIASSPVEMGCNAAWTVSVKLLAESGGFDRAQAWTIARAAIRALDRQRFPDADGFLDEIKIAGAGDLTVPGEIKTVWFDVACLMAG